MGGGVNKSPPLNAPNPVPKLPYFPHLAFT